VTHFPRYLTAYPNMNSAFPFHLNLKGLPRGYPAHRHDYLEFSYVVSGSGGETINGVLHPMKPGTFTFILPYQVHEIFTDPGSDLVLYNCIFSMDLLMETGVRDSFASLFDDSDRLPPFVQFEGDDVDAVGRLFEEMLREYEACDRWSETVLRAKLTEALVRFDRRRRREADAARADAADADARRMGSPAASPAAKPSVWPIIHYIHSNYREELTLADLAKKFSMSVSRISEVIKEATGQTYVHFLHGLRIRHASGLLVSTDMSVAEIAHEVGYGSYKTFSRIFRESKGVVPTQYRKRKWKATS